MKNSAMFQSLKQSNVAKGVAAAGAYVVASPVFAAVTAIDTADAEAQVAEGASAAGVIGLAILAFCILIGVLIKVRRAGS